MSGLQVAHYAILLCALATSLVAQSSGWFHPGLAVGFANKDVSPVELWSEVEMGNVGTTAVLVSLTARRFDGSEITHQSYTIEVGSKHVFRIEDPTTNVVAVDWLMHGEPLRAIVFVYAAPVGGGWLQNWELNSHVRILQLHGNQIKTVDLASLQPIENREFYWWDADVWSPSQNNDLVISNPTDEAKSALICRGSTQTGCLTATEATRIPAHATAVIYPTPGVGLLMIGDGLLPMAGHAVSGTSSTFDVNSGIKYTGVQDK
jgi:hypothetical protein